MPDVERSHGVTPGLSRDYLKRTAEKQAAFVAPYLRPGVRLLDVGCGPGTITVGLAEAVAPGHVTGIDHDEKHIESAQALVAEQGITNLFFESADALSLPFEDATFDAVFENNVFIHLGARARAAAEEARRVLKPGGFLAARDAAADAVIWGSNNDGIRQFDELFHRWQASRGSDIDLGKKLPTILREAGFVDAITSVSADTKSTREEVRSHAEILLSLLDGPMGEISLKSGWTDVATIASLRRSLNAWAEDPDAYFANVHIEVVAWKPAAAT
jgi:ubiquinone/menaquinone biosynthesis C-methylase UbiE